MCHYSRDLLEITIVTPRRDLGEFARERLRAHGFRARVCIRETSRHLALASTEMLGELEEFRLLREAIAPFSGWTAEFCEAADATRLELHLGSACAPLREGVRLEGPGASVAARRARGHGIDASVADEASADAPPLLEWRDGDAFTASELAWRLGMPPETRIVQNPSLDCAARAFCPGDEGRMRSALLAEDVIVRGSDPGATEALARRLEALGCRVRERIALPMDGVDPCHFRVLTDGWTARKRELPSRRRMLRALAGATEEWIGAHGVDAVLFPVDIEHVDRPVDPFDAVVVDAPMAEWRAGVLKPYARGLIGRYEIEVAAGGGVAESSLLASFLRDAGANHVRFSCKGVGRDAPSVVFAGGIVDDDEAMRRIVELTAEWLDEENPKVITVERTTRQIGADVRISAPGRR